jgi:hypothetical protein
MPSVWLRRKVFHPCEGSTSGHVLGDAGLADVDVEMEKFSVDSWHFPERVGDAHLA